MPETPAEPTRFLSFTDKELVIVGDPASGDAQLYWRPDFASPFFEMKIRGFEGDATNYKLVVDDILHDVLSEQLVRDGNQVIYRCESYWLTEPVTNLGEVTVIPLPV